MSWFCSCVSNSIATLTTINRPVALKEFASAAPLPPASPMNLKTTAGTSAMIARKIAPKRVILLLIFYKKSAVGLPGLMPGM